MSFGRGPVAVCLCVSALAACATGPHTSSASVPVATERAPLQSLAEPRALELIDGLLEESSLEPKRGFPVELEPKREVRVDLRVGNADVGIEWVSAADRARYGRLLPMPDRSGQLRVLTGGEPNGHAALILVLDHENYRFRSTAPAAEDDEHAVEQRIRRDLLEFIAYAKSQYLL